MTQNIIDIRNASLSEFEHFIFDHDVHPIGSGNIWYHQFDLTILYDPNHNAQRFIDMFLNAGQLAAKFHRKQLEQGCWAMVSSGLDGTLDDIIWESKIDLSRREALIASMFTLYSDLFALDPLENTCEMWWDALAYDINPMRRIDPKTNSDHAQVQTAMHNTLAKILKLPQRHCQFAALHGMNHVNHPDAPELIKSYVEDNQWLSDEQVTYARACANGTAM